MFGSAIKNRHNRSSRVVDIFYAGLVCKCKNFFSETDGISENSISSEKPFDITDDTKASRLKGVSDLAKRIKNKEYKYSINEEKRTDDFMKALIEIRDKEVQKPVLPTDFSDRIDFYLELLRITKERKLVLCLNKYRRRELYFINVELKQLIFESMGNCIAPKKSARDFFKENPKNFLITKRLNLLDKELYFKLLEILEPEKSFDNMKLFKETRILNFKKKFEKKMLTATYFLMLFGTGLFLNLILKQLIRLYFYVEYDIDAYAPRVSDYHLYRFR